MALSAFSENLLLSPQLPPQNFTLGQLVIQNTVTHTTLIEFIYRNYNPPQCPSATTTNRVYNCDRKDVSTNQCVYEMAYRPRRRGARCKRLYVHRPIYASLVVTKIQTEYTPSRTPYAQPPAKKCFQSRPSRIWPPKWSLAITTFVFQEQLNGKLLSNWQINT